MPAGFSCGHCSKVFIGEKEDKVYHSVEQHLDRHDVNKSESEIRQEIESIDESEVEGKIERVD